MNNKRNNYVNNVSSFYANDISNNKRVQKSSDFWGNVGEGVPFFAMGYVLGYILGIFLFVRYILWPIFEYIRYICGF